MLKRNSVLGPKWHQRLIEGVLFCTITLALQLSPANAGIGYQQQADELLPVDCLLPGAVRKMGGRLTYLTARRPIKTTGVNCEIRGGEYVLYDRADYKTALAIWQPMAEQGDARAQNYVGEIYEKGYGTEPNFELAAQWYAKAAEQKYAAAQVNLGQLYETGRGVEQSMDEAISWYRKAAGIKGQQLKFVSWDYSEEKYAEMQGTIASQGDALSAQQRKIESLTRKLDSSSSREAQLTAEISKARSGYVAELTELEKARQALAAQQEALDDLQRAARAAPAETDNQLKKQQLAQRKQEQLQQDQEIAQQRQQLASSVEGLEDKRSALQQQQAQLSQVQKQLQQKEQALASQEHTSVQKLREVEQEKLTVASQASALAAQLSELEAMKSDLQARQHEALRKEQLAEQKYTSVQAMSEQIAVQKLELEKLQQEVSQRESKLVSRESALQKKNSELEKLNEQLTSMRQQLTENASAFAGTTSADAATAKGPVIEMIEPRLLATRSGQYLVKTRAGVDQRTIIGRVMSPNPIIDLLVNEREVPIDERGIFQQRVPIQSAETKVSIVAIDKLGMRSDLEFVLGVEQAPEQDLLEVNEGQNVKKSPKRKVPKINFGNYHALIIGNKDYETLVDLDTTIFDATAVRDLLQNRYGFKTTLLTNATRYDMLSALEKLRSELTEDDNLLIYYAGHGELDEVNTRGHWLPVDAEENSRANWISNVAISDILNSMSANKVLVVADSCYSGSMTRSTLARLDAGRSNQAWVSWLKKQAISHSRLIFSSGGVAPVLDGGGGKHSIFSKAFLDVLDKNESVLEGREVHAQVAQAVNYAALAAQFDQTPMYAPIKFAGHEGGDFLFVPAEK